MKRILIFVVATLVALSMFALADNSWPTFQNGKLTFNSDAQVPHFYDPNFYVEQGFAATATAYDATFCGISGNVLYNNFCGNDQFSAGKSAVILASLNVESDATSVGVSIRVSTAAQMPDEMRLSYDYSGKFGAATYTVKTENPPSTLNLPFNSGANNHSGYLYVTANSTLSQLNDVQKCGMMFTFTIMPINYY